MFIKPEIKQVIVEGKVFYHEKNRRIHLKKEIIDAFIPSNDKTTDLEYSMEMYFDKVLFSGKIAESMEKGILPVLLFFKKLPKT